MKPDGKKKQYRCENLQNSGHGQADATKTKNQMKNMKVNLAAFECGELAEAAWDKAHDVQMAGNRGGERRGSERQPIPELQRADAVPVGGSVRDEMVRHLAVICMNTSGSKSQAKSVIAVEVERVGDGLRRSRVGDAVPDDNDFDVGRAGARRGT